MRNGEKKSRKFAKALRAEMTDAEVILWSFLRQHPRHRFRRQHPVGPYIADFACAPSRLIIEVDGATHSTDDEIAYDRRRESYLQRRGWRVIRVTNTDVYKSLPSVLDYIEGQVGLR